MFWSALFAALSQSNQQRGAGLGQLAEEHWTVAAGGPAARLQALRLGSLSSFGSPQHGHTASSALCERLPGRMSTAAADVAMADPPASLLLLQEQQQQQQDNSSQPAVPNSVLGLIADLHMFELQLGMLRQQAHMLAADRARIQGQLQYMRSAQHSIAPLPAAAGAAAAGVAGPTAAASGAQQLSRGLVGSSTGGQAGLRQQQSAGQPAVPQALADAKKQQQQQQLTVRAAAGSGSSSLKRSAQQLQDVGPATAQAKHQQHAAAAAPVAAETAKAPAAAAAAGAGKAVDAPAAAAAAAARAGRMKSMVVMGQAAKRPLPEEAKKVTLDSVVAAAGQSAAAAAAATGADPAAKRPRRSEAAAAEGEGAATDAGAAGAAPAAAAVEQQQQVVHASDAADGERQRAPPQQQQPQQQQPQQQQQQPRHLPSAPLPLAQQVENNKALDAVADALPSTVAALAVARQAAGSPFPLVPPLLAPGVQQGPGQPQQEVLLMDAASLRVWVRRLCPALDALLALTPSNEGAHLQNIAYGRPEKGNPRWRSDLCGPDGLTASQLLSPSGTKVALNALAVPYLKAACTAALASARGSPQGMKVFFWAAHEGLVAQLQHGVTVEQGSTRNAGTVLRQCVLSCTHLACMLVKVYNMLLAAPQQQQQGRPRRQQQQQQQAAGGEGDAPELAAAAAAAAAAADGAPDAAAGQQQQQQGDGMLPCAKLSPDATNAAYGAMHAMIAARARGNKTVKQLVKKEQLPTMKDPHRDAIQQGPRLVAVLMLQSDVQPIVQGLCPALEALLALHPVANALPVVPFPPKLTQEQVDRAQQGWLAKTTIRIRSEQLLSREGFQCALGGVINASFKETILKLCEDSQQARALNAAAARLEKGRDGGVTGLFWGVLGLLQVELASGITSRPQSNAKVSEVIRQYVLSVTHVANVLVHLYNALLMQKAQLEQQVQQQGHGMAAAAAAPVGTGGSGGAATAAAGGAPAPQEQVGHGPAAAGGDVGGGGGGAKGWAPAYVEDRAPAAVAVVRQQRQHQPQQQQ